MGMKKGWQSLSSSTDEPGWRLGAGNAKNQNQMSQTSKKKKDKGFLVKKSFGHLALLMW